MTNNNAFKYQNDIDHNEFEIIEAEDEEAIISPEEIAEFENKRLASEAFKEAIKLKIQEALAVPDNEVRQPYVTKQLNRYRQIHHRVNVSANKALLTQNRLKRGGKGQGNNNAKNQFNNNNNNNNNQKNRKSSKNSNSVTNRTADVKIRAIDRLFSTRNTNSMEDVTAEIQSMNLTKNHRTNQADETDNSSSSSDDDHEEGTEEKDSYISLNSNLSSVDSGSNDQPGKSKFDDVSVEKINSSKFNLVSNSKPDSALVSATRSNTAHRSHRSRINSFWDPREVLNVKARLQTATNEEEERRKAELSSRKERLLIQSGKKLEISDIRGSSQKKATSSNTAANTNGTYTITSSTGLPVIEYKKAHALPTINETRKANINAVIPVPVLFKYKPSCIS